MCVCVCVCARVHVCTSEVAMMAFNLYRKSHRVHTHAPINHHGNKSNQHMHHARAIVPEMEGTPYSMHRAHVHVHGTVH